MNNNMSYEPPNTNYNIGSNTNAPTKKEVEPIRENVGKAEVIVTYVKKYVENGVVQEKLCGIKSVITGYIDYSGNYNSKYFVKYVTKKFETIFHPFEKSFNVDFIKLPLGDSKYKFIPKASIVSVDVSVSEHLVEIDETRIPRY